MFCLVVNASLILQTKSFSLISLKFITASLASAQIYLLHLGCVFLILFCKVTKTKTNPVFVLTHHNSNKWKLVLFATQVRRFSSIGILYFSKYKFFSKITFNAKFWISKFPKTLVFCEFIATIVKDKTAYRVITIIVCRCVYVFVKLRTRASELENWEGEDIYTSNIGDTRFKQAECACTCRIWWRRARALQTSPLDEDPSGKRQPAVGSTDGVVAAMSSFSAPPAAARASNAGRFSSWMVRFWKGVGNLLVYSTNKYKGFECKGLPICRRNKRVLNTSTKSIKTISSSKILPPSWILLTNSLSALTSSTKSFLSVVCSRIHRFNCSNYSALKRSFFA